MNQAVRTVATCALVVAAAGDTIVFLPGLHQHGLGRHRAILSVEKP